MIPKLPPLPVPPKRSLTPPTRGSGTFRLDDPTPSRTLKTAKLGALVSVFEELSAEQQDDLVELGYLLRRLGVAERKYLLEVAIRANGLG